MVLETQMILSIATGITVLGTAYLTARKIIKDSQASVAKREEELMTQAKEHDQKLFLEIKSELEVLETKITNLEADFNKELSFVKEVHNNELKQLGEKIENLRDDLKVQHSNLLTLITKLIERN